MSNKAESIFGVKVAQFVFRYAPWILTGIVLLCVLAFPYAANLKLHANFLELLPADSESVTNLKELTAEVGGTTYVICVIEAPDNASADTLSRLLSEKVAQLPGVESVVDQSKVSEFQDRKLLFLKLSSFDILKDKIMAVLAHYRRQLHPFSLNLLQEEPPKIDLEGLELEHKIYRIGGAANPQGEGQLAIRIVMMKPRHTVGDFEDSRRLFSAVRQVFDEIRLSRNIPSAELGFAGAYATRESEYRSLSGDLQLTGILAVIFIAFILWIAFRSVRYLLFACLPLAASLILTLAFTDLTIGYLNLITAFLVSILFGMGSDYTLHILVNLEPEMSTKQDLYKIIERTYCQLWRPLFSSMLTTAVAFGAMAVSGFEGFRHFGIIAGTGILIAFAVVFFGLPSLVIVTEKYFPSKPRPPMRAHRVSKKMVTPLVIAGIAITLFCVTQIPKVRFNYDFSKLQADSQSIELSQKLSTYFGLQLSPVALVTPNSRRTAETVKMIEKHIADNPSTEFDFVASLETHVPGDQAAKIEKLKELDALLEQKKPLLDRLDEDARQKVTELRNQLKATSFTAKDLPMSVKRQYEGDHGKVSVVWVYPKGDIINGKVTQRFVKELRSLPLEKDIKIAGDPIIFADVLNQMETDTPIMMTLSIITVIGLVFVHFRRLDYVLWVLAPVSIGFLWACGFSGVSGLNFNFINLAILPSVLGVGIDSGIYIFDHYKNKKDANFFVSMQRTSKGVILSSATNIAAFASLAFAQHKGMASMGLLGVFGFFSCLVAAVYFIPSILEFFELRKKNLLRRSGES